MKRSDYLVIVPAYNEEKNIGHVLHEIAKHNPNVDMLVINDGSEDQTEQVVKSLGIEVLSHCSNLGYSGAILSGLKYAMIMNYNYVVQFDGDGQHDPKEIHRLIAATLSENVDIVIGSRFLEANDYNHGILRRMGSSLFTAIIKLMTRENITDPTSGLQILHKNVFSYYVLSGNYPEYPDANILILISKIGFKIKEVPVIMHERLSGVGMHASMISNIKYMISMSYSIFLLILKGNKTV